MENIYTNQLCGLIFFIFPKGGGGFVQMTDCVDKPSGRERQRRQKKQWESKELAVLVALKVGVMVNDEVVVIVHDSLISWSSMVYSIILSQWQIDNE